MNPTIVAGSIRALIIAALLAAGAFFTSYQVTDTSCKAHTAATPDGGTTVVEDENCGWKPVIVATGAAFFGALGLRIGESGIDSRNSAQVELDRQKRGPAAV